MISVAPGTHVHKNTITLLVCKLAPVHRGQGENRGRGRLFQIGSGRFNKGTYLRGLSWAVPDGRSLPPSARILKVIEALTGFNHVFSRVGLGNTLLAQGCMLEMAVSMGIVSSTYIPRTEEGVRSLLLPGSNSPVNRWSLPLRDPLQHIC